MKVKVYRNLHKQCYSVVAMEGPKKGRVVHHSEYVLLSNVSFKVRQGGREKVLKEKRKNVHAFVIGNLESLGPLRCAMENRCIVPITYNPYKNKEFVSVGTGREIVKCGWCKLDTTGVYGYDVSYRTSRQMEMSI